MARRASGEQREGNTKGRRASVIKMGGTVGSRRASQQEVSPIGHANGRSAAHAEDRDQLHQQIAERAFFLYERSGFQEGNHLEHWLEAERPIKGVRDRAA